ncbi:ABC transporter substrate-binding protein [Oscillatoriales cyanobacterium LEGE 11467]|uniref:Thiamine pyrimidine synthase n=1 Tax=Zarconia navalis LEGE 11467 TaxID=1828826 RepID=A0A928VU68_9CYAN|nr:ABC transporter substrate-binding protein [Zarconia navalis]MBE9039393.1 ABC transporter substrate-binding protein [Zarconia navalis LEGE 11467]
MTQARRRFIVQLAVAFAMTTSLFACEYPSSNVPIDEASTPATATSVSMRLPIPVADTAFAPYYLCIDKGICAKHGISLNLEPGSPELNPVKMLSQGTDQFAVVGGPEILFTAKSKGAPIVSITLVHKDSNFVTLLALKGSNITQLSDLQDKKVGFFYGHISTDVLQMLFKKEDIQVQEVDVGFDYSQLITEKLDAQWAFRTTAGITLPAQGVEVISINPDEYGITTQGHVVLTSEQMRENQPEIVQAFTNAILESIAYSIENEQEAIEATIKRDATFKQEVGQQQLAIYNAAIENNSKIGLISDEDMEKTKEQMLLLELLPKDFNTQSAYTNQFVENYYQEN